MQIDYALELIDELHPLENTPLHKVYPVLKHLCCCFECVPTIKKENTETEDIEEPLIEKLKGRFVMINGKLVKKKTLRQRKKPADR